MAPEPADPAAPLPEELPVFPLPGVVLFPGALLPLEIFEERYRRMLEDVLPGDRLLALALLRPCTEEEYERAPPFYETVCVGRILHSEEPDAEGRARIVLAGVAAARAQPVESDKPYRVARVEVLPDETAPGELDATRLRAVFGALPVLGTDLELLREKLRELVPEEAVEAALLNTCALAAPLLPRDKLSLLEERDLHRRLERLELLLRRPWRWN